MTDNSKHNKTSTDDKYVHGMDWSSNVSETFELKNYRKYQYDLIGKYIGKNILEVGSGDRSFTNQIIKNSKDIARLVSIEPSSSLMGLHKNKYKFPDYVSFEPLDLFEMSPKSFGLFDTIILVHVLEHIENDRDAITHLYSLLAPGGKLLIEVPATPFLFSVHDKMLGHYRRYNKSILKAAIDPNLFNIKDIWYQDAIGLLGSFVFFKTRKIKLKSTEGISLVKNQGGIYDKFIIPFEGIYEKYIHFPFGLSLTCVLEKH